MHETEGQGFCLPCQLLEWRAVVGQPVFSEFKVRSRPGGTAAPASVAIPTIEC